MQILVHRVYEVEMPNPAPGQRYCQHVKAVDEIDAAAKVRKTQRLPAIAVRVWRDCRLEEVTAMRLRDMSLRGIRKEIAFRVAMWFDVRSQGVRA